MAENFAALIERVARARAERPALAWPGGTLTWEELDLRASRCAGALSARGIHAGDRIALAFPNGWEFAVAFLGALKLGATVAPLNPRLTDHELTGITGDLAPALVMSALPEGGATLRARMPAGSPALILYTSGSTGRPKGSVFSHEALITANRSWAGPVMSLTPDDVVLGALPFAHSFGLNGALLAPLLAGACVAPLDRFAPDATVDAIRALRVTVLPAVATMFRRLLDSPALGAGRLASLRLALSGAAPCPWDLAQEWRERTGVRLLRGYGMTELFRPISYLAGDPVERPEAIGRAVPGVELRVVDDDGAPVSPGEAGELLIWSAARLDGYLAPPGGPDHPAVPDVPAALGGKGWFATGDLARIGPDGLVSIVGRKKDLILRGGYSVSPPEVEAVLSTHPAIVEAAVIGLPHPDLGEDVAAFVVLRTDAHAEPDELIAHCAIRLAAFKCPRQIRFVTSLPRSETGKVQKWRLPTL
jgi:long-chain acyl-CoA synthetase